MKKYRCTVCDWIYDPEVGDPDSGIAPGTAFEDIPDDDEYETVADLFINRLQDLFEIDEQ